MGTVPTLPVLNAGLVMPSQSMNQLGAASTFLTGSGSGQVPLWMVERTSGGTQAASTDTAVIWDTELKDNTGVFTAPSGNIVIQTPGFYSVDWSIVTTGGHAAGQLDGYLSITTTANNPFNPSVTTFCQYSGIPAIEAAVFCIPSGGGIVPLYLFTGDVLSVHLVTDASGSWTFSGAGQPPAFSGRWVSN